MQTNNVQRSQNICSRNQFFVHWAGEPGPRLATRELELEVFANKIFARSPFLLKSAVNLGIFKNIY